MYATQVMMHLKYHVMPCFTQPAPPAEVCVYAMFMCSRAWARKVVKAVDVPELQEAHMAHVCVCVCVCECWGGGEWVKGREVCAQMCGGGRWEEATCVEPQRTSCQHMLHRSHTHTHAARTQMGRPRSRRLQTAWRPRRPFCTLELVVRYVVRMHTITL